MVVAAFLFAATALAADTAYFQQRVDYRIEARLDEASEPLELAVTGTTQRLESRERRQVVTVMSTTQPTEARLDPQRILLDIDSANDRKRIPR